MSKFLNPYNFISLPPKKEGVYKKDEKECLTGVIHYIVTTKSPLFIPNSSADEVFEQSTRAVDHKSYDFFSYKQLKPYTETGKNPVAPTPVIPGSEMRGVIRSVYETLTDSCMGVLNSDTLPIKRSAHRFEPGLIRKDGSGYTLIKATSLRIGGRAYGNGLPSGFGNMKNGTLVYYKDSEDIENKRLINQSEFKTAGDSEYSKEGYLIKWGMGGRKARYHLYSPEEEKGTEQSVKVMELSRDILEAKLVSVIESYLNRTPARQSNTERYREYERDMGAYKEYKRDLEEFMDRSAEGTEYFPVNYSYLPDGKFYLSPAVITKEISNNSVGTLAGDFAPCNGAVECPACELFGHVSKNGDYSRGSQVRFSDLYVTKKQDNETYFYDVCTLPALNSPKLGNTEFYLKQPGDATFWTYDYYVENGEVKVEKEQLQLRGRKYYWHHPQKETSDERRDNTTPNIPSDIDPDKLRKTVRPLRPNITFAGELYFEGISEKQLKQLVWICNSGAEKLGYKLGAAKPFGFGSVVCNVTSVEKRDIDIRDGRIVYSKSGDQKIKYQCTYEEAGFSKHCKKEFYRIAGLDSVKQILGSDSDESETKITYPQTLKQFDNGTTDEGFLWYLQNRKTMGGDGMPKSREDIRIYTALPALEEEDVCLPCFISGEGRVLGATQRGLQLRVRMINSRETINIHISNLNIRGGRDEMIREYPQDTKVMITYTGRNNSGYPTYHVDKIKSD